jgi:hypothetical protein
MGLSPSIVHDLSTRSNAIINVLHLFISRTEIGLDYVAIVNHGIKCTDNKINVGRYLLSFMLPTTDDSITCACKCPIERGAYFQPDCILEVACTVIGRLPPRPAEMKYGLTGDVAERSGLFDVGYFSEMYRRIVLRKSCVESIAKIRTVANESVLRFEEHDIGQALTESTRQICSIFNFPLDDQSMICTDNGDNLFELTFLLEDHKSDPIRVKFKTDRVELHQKRDNGLQIKKTASHRALSFPYDTIALDGHLSVCCSGGLQHVRPPFPVDSYIFSIMLCSSIKKLYWLLSVAAVFRPLLSSGRCCLPAAAVFRPLLSSGRRCLPAAAFGT